jgi:hypothetical protein
MMADRIKPRLKKLDPDQRLRALLELHPKDWTATPKPNFSWSWASSNCPPALAALARIRKAR